MKKPFRFIFEWLFYSKSVDTFYSIFLVSFSIYDYSYIY